jgi:hypothetical protein
MDRRERRRRARERKKLEERLKREAARPHPVREESLTVPKRFLRSLKKAVSWPRVAWTILAPGVSLLSVYALVHPHVSIEPTISLNPRDPYSTQFTVKNENRVFDAHEIHCVCWPRRMQTGNNIGVLSFTPLPNVQHTIPVLSPGSSSTVDCPAVIGGLGAWSGEVLDAQLEIVVSYNQSMWPFGTVRERNAFTTKRDSQHGVHWVHTTPAEERPILP